MKSKIDKIGIMQPYFLPYIGYFQHVNSVDKFVFLDDVSFINRGWINRNRILINEKAHYITIPLIKASQNKTINEINFIDERKKLLKTIQHAYKAAPFYNKIIPIIEEIIEYNTTSISELAIFSVKRISEHLEINTSFEICSNSYLGSQQLKKEEKIIYICKLNEASTYINPSGGEAIYSKIDFERQGLDLKFIKSNGIEYQQFNKPFIANLSIIDVLMFNSLEKVKSMLNDYSLS